MGRLCCTLPKAEPSRMVEEELKADFISHIRILYDSGAPLFTKKRLEEIVQQFKDCEQSGSHTGRKIFTRGIDGMKVQFPVETGKIYAGDPGEDEELVLTSPVIRYVSFQDLTEDSSPRFLNLVYCTMQICFFVEQRRKSDKEPIDPVPVATPQETERFFLETQEMWESSETCRRLRDTLLLWIGVLPDVRKIVAFALSNLSLIDSDDGEVEWILARRAAYQHSMLLTIRAVLLEASWQHPPESISCYAQDPIYTASDKAVLQNHFITVVDDPQGFIEVDNSTIVVSISANAPVKEVITDIAMPVMIIWDRLPHEGEEGFGRPATDPNSPRVVKMIRDYYDEYEFPPGEREHLGDLAIYIRRREMD